MDKITVNVEEKLSKIDDKDNNVEYKVYDAELFEGGR